MKIRKALVSFIFFSGLTLSFVAFVNASEDDAGSGRPSCIAPIEIPTEIPTDLPTVTE